MAFEFTDGNIKQIIESGKPVMVDVWATWCGPCKRMAPAVDELADEYADKVVIGKYNADENDEFGSENRIMSLPTILFYKNGEQVKDLRLVGGQSKENLKKNIEKLLEL